MLLQKGDIIRLTKGMKVNTIVPAKFVHTFKLFTKKTIKSSVRIGEPVSRGILGTEAALKRKVKNALEEIGIEEISESKLQEIARVLGIDFTENEYDTNYLVGEYEVVDTTYDGGGYNSFDVEIPDGYHVFCEKLDNREIKVDFYQTGCFYSVITDIEPINI